METQSKEQQQPRNACVSCRSKKIRCLPSDVPGTCQKCQKLQQECELPGVILRPRRKKLIHRIEQLERGLGNVSAELAEQRSLDSSSVTSNQAITASTTPDAYSRPGNSLAASLPLPSGQDVFQKGILTPEYADVLLSEFKMMAQKFPYIVLPEASTTAGLRRERPMLLLAILATASWQNRPLQIALEQHYLNEVSVKMVVRSEQSLDILQSLLVYLAWCHFHMKSANRLTALAISNVVTLGLDCRPASNRSRGQRNLRPSFEFNRGPDPPLQSGFWGAEARRAYIGCYFISTSYSLGLRKAGALRYSKYLEECALSLAAESQVVSDTTLIHYVRIIHHAEEVNEIFGYMDSEQDPPVFTDERLQFYIKYFDTQLQTLKANIPIGLAGDPVLQASLILVHVYTHEIGLYNISATSLSPIRMTVLHDCLLSIQQVLDILATAEDDFLQTIMGYSWARVHYSISLAMEITLGIVSPSWSIESVRNIIKLETYLDLFCSRLTTLSASIQEDQSAEQGSGNWFQMLAENLAGLRNKYANGLRVRGIHIPDREVHIMNHGGANTNLAHNQGVGNVPYGYTDISSIDFMLNDWAWQAPDPNLFGNQLL